MTLSAAPLIYILIFVAVVALVEGIYLTVFGKSISLNSRMSRRLALLDKNHNREEVLEQLRKEASQHANSRGILPRVEGRYLSRAESGTAGAGYADRDGLR